MKLFGLVAACAALLGVSVSAAESCESADLIHRWSFNGSLADACGGNTARFDGGGCRFAARAVRAPDPHEGVILLDF